MQKAIPATRYKPYTQEDDERLVVYLATHNVRTGSSTPYKNIVNNDDGTSPWGAERTWAGWRSRYAHHKHTFDKRIETYRLKHGIVMQPELQPEPDLILTMSNATLTKTPGPSGFTTQNLYSTSALSSSLSRHDARATSSESSADTTHVTSIVDKVIGVNFSKLDQSKNYSVNQKTPSPISPSRSSTDVQTADDDFLAGADSLFHSPSASLHPSETDVESSGDSEFSSELTSRLASNAISSLYDKTSTSHVLPARMARKRKRALDSPSSAMASSNQEHSNIQHPDIRPSTDKSARMVSMSVQKPSQEQTPVRPEHDKSSDPYPPRSPTSRSHGQTPSSSTLSEPPHAMDDNSSIALFGDGSELNTDRVQAYSNSVDKGTSDPSDPQSPNFMPHETDSEDAELMGTEYMPEQRSAALSASGVGWGGLGHLLGFSL